MRKSIYILMLSIVIGLISSVWGKYFLLIVLGILYLVFCYMKTKTAFWFSYVLFLAFPVIDMTNISKFLIINIFGFNISILDISIFLIFLIVLIKKKTKKKISINNFSNICIIILVFNYFVYIIIGLNNVGYKAILDGKSYIIQVVLYFCAYNLMKNDNIYKLLKVTLLGLAINSLISIFIYITSGWSVWGLNYNGGRFGNNSQTVFIMSISYTIFLLYAKRNKLNRIGIYILLLLLQFILIILSQNRTNFILSALSTGLILIICFKNSKNNFIHKRKLFFILATIIVLFISGNIILNSNIQIINRLKSGKDSKENTLVTRVNTIIYYTNKIANKPMGNGFGANMPFANSRTTIYIQDQERLNADNIFITIGYKLGIINLFIYSILLFKVYIDLIKLYKNKKDKIYLCIGIFYTMIIIAGGLLTSQIIHSYAVFSFIWVLVSFLNIETNKINIQMKKN